jgi:hypothetical protein
VVRPVPRVPRRNPVIKRQSFNVSHQRVSAVISDAGLLRIVKNPCLLDVFDRFGQNDDLSHALRLAKRFSSWVSVRDSPHPAATLARRCFHWAMILFA